MYSWATSEERGEKVYAFENPGSEGAYSSGADIKLIFDIAKVSNANFVFIPYAGAGFPYLWRGGASLGIRF